MLTLLSVLVFSQTAQPDMRQWGLETIRSFRKDLAMPSGPLLGEEAKPGQPPTQVSYDWGVGVAMSALNAGAEADPSLKPVLREYVEATRVYWNPAPPVAGYDVHPLPKPTDRFYDDNEWMVLALVEAGDILHSKECLGYAEDAFRFVLSGEDSKLGGGIYWRESEKTSKNTCSNGPAAACALALYEKNHRPDLLREAESIYAWTKAHLQDPSDGLYWDNISLSGRIQKAKWTYNSGLMLRSSVDLYRFTKRREYADDARQIVNSSIQKWVGPSGELKEDGKFFHLLTENWLRAYRWVPGVVDPRPILVRGLTRLHEVGRDSLGHYGSRWDDSPQNGPYSHYTLLDMGAAARAYLTTAKALDR